MLHVRALRTAGGTVVNFDIGEGEALALVGPSGSGKTRALRAIADLDPNDADIALDGIAREVTPAPQWRAMVMYVPTESGWWHDTVAPHMSDAGAASTYLAALGLPGDALSWPVSRLSTGERQRLALIRALVRRPRVLLLDEPTASLDEDATGRVEILLQHWLDDGGALILVTHDRRLAERIAPRHLSLAAVATASVAS